MGKKKKKRRARGGRRTGTWHVGVLEFPVWLQMPNAKPMAAVIVVNAKGPKVLAMAPFAIDEDPVEPVREVLQRARKGRGGGKRSLSRSASWPKSIVCCPAPAVSLVGQCIPEDIELEARASLESVERAMDGFLETFKDDFEGTPQLATGILEAVPALVESASRLHSAEGFASYDDTIALEIAGGSDALSFPVATVMGEATEMTGIACFQSVADAQETVKGEFEGAPPPSLGLWFAHRDDVPPWERDEFEAAGLAEGVYPVGLSQRNGGLEILRGENPGDIELAQELVRLTNILAHFVEAYPEPPADETTETLELDGETLEIQVHRLQPALSQRVPDDALLEHNASIQAVGFPAHMFGSLMRDHGQEVPEVQDGDARPLLLIAAQDDEARALIETLRTSDARGLEIAASPFGETEGQALIVRDGDGARIGTLAVVPPPIADDVLGMAATYGGQIPVSVAGAGPQRRDERLLQADSVTGVFLLELVDTTSTEA